MQGSLDEPPIIIQQSRTKLGLTVLLGVALVAFCCWLFFPGMHSGSLTETVEDGAIVIVLAVVGVFHAWAFVHPGSLEIGPDGVVWRTTLKIFRYDWADFDGFVVAYNSRGNSKYPDAVFSKDCKKYLAARTLWPGTTLGYYWELSADEVVNILNKAQAKWGGAGRRF